MCPFIYGLANFLLTLGGGQSMLVVFLLFVFNTRGSKGRVEVLVLPRTKEERPVSDPSRTEGGIQISVGLGQLCQGKH